MRMWFAATGVASVVFLSACGGGSSDGSIGGSTPPVVPPASQNYTVTSTEYTVKPASGSAPSVTMNIISVPGLPTSGGVAVAKDGAVWWESPTTSSGEMVRMQGKSVATVPFDQTKILGGPYSAMTATPDGRVWGSSNCSCGNVQDWTYFSASAHSTIVSPTGDVQGLQNLVTGPDGNAWFSGSYVDASVPDAPQISSFGNSAGLSRLFNQNAPSFESIAVGPDKLMWIYSGAPMFQPQSFTFYRYSTSGALVGTVPVSNYNGSLGNIIAGPDGAMWSVGGNDVVRIDTSGHATLYPVSVPGESQLLLNGITVGGDGALWFTDNFGEIGRITTSGSITLYDVPHRYAGNQITGPLTSPGCGNFELFSATNGGPLIQIIIKPS